MTRVTVNSMADESPLAQVAVLPEGEPRIPAPLGRTLLFVSLALLCSTGMCWCLKENGISPETGEISGRPLALVSDWTGRIELFWVKPGDTVQAGDPIAILLDEQLLLQIDRKKREVEEIRLALRQAEKSLDDQLAQELGEMDAEIVSLRTKAGAFFSGEPAPGSQLEELEAKRLDAVHEASQRLGIDRIREELLRAEAMLRELEHQPKQITLPASATGTIKRILQQPGDRVVPGTPILELANQDRPYLIVEMPEPLAKRFALGDKIPLSFPGSENTLGRVTDMHRLKPRHAVDPNVPDAPKPEATVRVEIEPLDGGWPELPFESKVRVRTSDSRAMSRRVH